MPRRQPQCGLERCFVSDTGYVLVFGWTADEGRAPRRIVVGWADGSLIDIPPGNTLRYARPDLEAKLGTGGYDCGLIAFGALPHPMTRRPRSVRILSDDDVLLVEREFEVLTEKKMLDSLLIMAAKCPSHAGKEVDLAAFLIGEAGSAMAEIYRGHVARATAGHSVHRFRPRPVARSFVTVLFGSTEAMPLQPVLFRDQRIDFGEWIYVCNSPEDATAALRLAQTMSDLYDLPLTVIVMSDNAGFGAANNVAVGHAASDSIYLVNPDVYPLAPHAAALRDTLEHRALGNSLWGGLLFYDDDTLMHGGMYVEQDLCFRKAPSRPGASPPPFGLLRVEHYDKGIPFDETRWDRPVAVPAVTGALMAFDRRAFERIGGFSTDYVYGHYEDADLSLRWSEHNGPVVIDPKLRLVHLEGQGSRVRGEQYGAAAVINRYLFSLRHGPRTRAGPAPHGVDAADRPA